MEPQIKKSDTLFVIHHELCKINEMLRKEKETLSIVFGLERVHEYLHGLRFS